jgi:hypothetical protein
MLFSITQPEKPLMLGAVSTPACDGLKDGKIEAIASGGTAPYLYALGNRSGFLPPSTFNVFQGNHKVYVSDYNDCIAETNVVTPVLNTMPDINFMLATSRYELDTLVVIDVSVPPPDKVTWEFSDEATIIETGTNLAKIRYNSAGLYPVTMTGLFGSCAYTIYRILNIAPFDPSVINADKDKDGIRSLKISPNPNNGSFGLSIEMYTRQRITVRIFDLSSKVIFEESLSPELEFTREISLPDTVLPGTYVLKVTGENDSRSVVFVISK